MNVRVSYSFYRRIIKYRWPGKSTSCTAIQSKFYGLISPSTNAYNFYTIKHKVWNLWSGYIKCAHIFYDINIYPAYLSEYTLLIPNKSLKFLPKYSKNWFCVYKHKFLAVFITTYILSLRLEFWYLPLINCVYIYLSV